MQAVSFKIWTPAAMSISYDSNTMNISLSIYIAGYSEK